MRSNRILLVLYTYILLLRRFSFLRPFHRNNICVYARAFVCNAYRNCDE